MIYFDTACLVKCYLDERGSDAVRKLAAASSRIACCSYGRLELAATLYRNFCEGKISQAQRKVLFQQMDLDDSNPIWTWLPVTAELLADTSARLSILRTTLHLRAADALHLACAAGHGFEKIFSNDRHLLRAAAACKIKGCNVIA